jgi:hypothetical protein
MPLPSSVSAHGDQGISTKYPDGLISAAARRRLLAAQRNAERYRLIKWATNALTGVRVHDLAERTDVAFGKTPRTD